MNDLEYLIRKACAMLAYPFFLAFMLCFALLLAWAARADWENRTLSSDLDGGH